MILFSLVVMVLAQLVGAILTFVIATQETKVFGSWIVGILNILTGKCK